MAPAQRHQQEENFNPQYFYEGENVPHGQVASDEELEDVVKELIHNSHRLDGSDITVTVDHADVKLSGTVRTEEEKIAAGSLVQLIHGIGLIKNELIVKRNEGILPTDVGRKG